jgi:anti-anti-sigma factor
MSIKHTLKNDSLTLSIHGRFDFSVHQEFRASYRNIQPDAVGQIIVDLHAVEYMDSASLGMLLLLGEHFSGKRVQLIHASTLIRQILDIANFKKKFDIR